MVSRCFILHFTDYDGIRIFSYIWRVTFIFFVKIASASIFQIFVLGSVFSPSVFKSYWCIVAICPFLVSVVNTFSQFFSSFSPSFSVVSCRVLDVLKCTQIYQSSLLLLLDLDSYLESLFLIHKEVVMHSSRYLWCDFILTFRFWIHLEFILLNTMKYVPFFSPNSYLVFPAPFIKRRSLLQLFEMVLLTCAEFQTILDKYSIFWVICILMWQYYTF